MRITWKGLLGIVAGAFILGSTISVAAQDSTPTPDGGSSAESEERDGPKLGLRRGLHGPGKHAIRSEAVLPPLEDGGEFRTVRTDQGRLERIDGSTLVIAEEDGTEVTVPVQDDTRIRREREEAELSDLEVGDHVHTVRVKEGSGDFVTEGIHAVSAERYAELEERRAEFAERIEACREDPDAEDCPRRPRGPRGGRGFGPPGQMGEMGDVDAAPVPAPNGEAAAA